MENALATGPATLHRALRAATHDTHLRLHAHAGFAAVQNGTITLPQYRALLIRLYGFHAALPAPGCRASWLREDLHTLGLPQQALATLPLCPGLDATAGATPSWRLGLRYVVEGASLGGQVLARGLDALLGPGQPAGRRFFIGHGAQTGASWRGVLAMLALVPETGSARADAILGARETFTIFENWLTGWETHTAWTTTD